MIVTKPIHPSFIVTPSPHLYEGYGYPCVGMEEALRVIDGYQALGVDSETTGLNPRRDKVFAIQIGTGSENFLFDFQKPGLDMASLMGVLSRKYLVFHNGLFDTGFFRHLGFIPMPGLIFDTMIASRVLYNGKVFETTDFVKVGDEHEDDGGPDLFDEIGPEIADVGVKKIGPREVRMSHSFDAVMYRELRLWYSKTEQKNIHIVKLGSQQAVDYCFNDVDRLLELHSHLRGKLKKRGQIPTYVLQCSKIATIGYVEYCGMPVSSDSLDRKITSDKANMDRFAQEVIDYIYDNLPKYRRAQGELFATNKQIEPKLSSVQQMIPVFEDLGINVTTMEKGVEKKSINKDSLALIDHPFIKIWLNYANAVHAVNNFGEKLKDLMEDGRLYPRFSLMVDTSRIAGLAKSGLNALNLPRDEMMRCIFEAKEGSKIIVCDYDGQEKRILAHVSKDKMLMEILLKDLDAHNAFARLIFPEIAHLSDKEIKKDHSEKRTAAKAPGFALAYGGGPMTLHLNTGLPLKECKRLFKLYREDLHPDVFEWGRAMFAEAVQNGYIESCDGWKLYLPKRDLWLKAKTKIENMGILGKSMYKIGKESVRTSELAEKTVDTCVKFMRGISANDLAKLRKLANGSDMEEVEEALDLYEAGKKAEAYSLMEKTANASRPMIEVNPNTVVKVRAGESSWNPSTLGECIDFYESWKKTFQTVRMIESDWERLCLNSKIQTIGAHMTALAMRDLYIHIVERGHYGRAKIINAPYDEIVMEVEDDLVEEYQEALGRIMREAGQVYIENSEIPVLADADVGANWHTAKYPPKPTESTIK